MSLQKKINRAEEQAKVEQTIAVCDWFEETLLETPGIGPKRAAAIMHKVQEKAKEQMEAKQ